MLIAFGATAIATLLGTTLGFLAAHFRGWVEQAVLMLIDFQASVPFLIVALAVLAFFGNSLVLFVMLMGLNSWERYARIARGLTLSANEQGYAAAVRQLGATNVRVYGLHVLPNIASTLIVSMTITFPETILLESGLSFLGLGVQPPTSADRPRSITWVRPCSRGFFERAGMSRKGTIGPRRPCLRPRSPPPSRPRPVTTLPFPSTAHA